MIEPKLRGAANKIEDAIEIHSALGSANEMFIVKVMPSTDISNEAVTNSDFI